MKDFGFPMKDPTYVGEDVSQFSYAQMIIAHRYESSFYQRKSQEQRNCNSLYFYGKYDFRNASHLHV